MRKLFNGIERFFCPLLIETGEAEVDEDNRGEIPATFEQYLFQVFHEFVHS